MNADEFYALRDHRTNLCVTTLEYQKVECVVRASHDVTTFATQLTLLVACNLLSRWCRTVWIDIPDVQCCEAIGASSTPLRERLIAEMRSADPFGNFRVLERTCPDALELHIGRCAEVGCSPVQVHGAGWYASHGTLLPAHASTESELNPFGAIAAACIGVAELFRRASDKNAVGTRPFIFDAFALEFIGEAEIVTRPFQPGCNVGNILMIGAGAVGSSAMFCLMYAAVLASLTCVDYDVVKISNLNRSPMLTVDDVTLKKVTALQRSLRATRIKVDPIESDWAGFIAARSRSRLKYDLWLPLANEHGVRWSIASNLPPLLIHSSTGSSWAVNFGRHIPLRGECLADRFPDSADAAAFQCATGQVATPEGNVDAALPFLSCFAGMLIAADVVKTRMLGYPHTPGFAEFGFRNGFQGHAHNRSARRGCVCTTTTPELWREVISQTAHSALSE